MMITNYLNEFVDKNIKDKRSIKISKSKKIKILRKQIKKRHCSVYCQINIHVYTEAQQFFLIQENISH